MDAELVGKLLWALGTSGVAVAVALASGRVRAVLRATLWPERPDRQAPRYPHPPAGASV